MTLIKYTVDGAKVAYDGAPDQLCWYPVTDVEPNLARLRAENERLTGRAGLLAIEVEKQQIELNALRRPLEQSDIARLSSPPQERAEIVERESAYRHNCGPFGHLSQEQASQAFADVATLLGDCAAWRNALAVSQAKCRGLEVALQFYAALENHQGNAATGHVPIVDDDNLGDRARAALAASQQHTPARTPEQYAIEHGRYLATAAQLFMDSCNALFSAEQELDKAEPDTQEQVDDLISKAERAQEIRGERWRALERAIYEFTKRADRAYTLKQHTPKHQPHCMMLDPEEPETKCTCVAGSGDGVAGD